MLEEAKQDLKNKIIAENSEEHYYNLIADRVKPLYEFKQAGDFVFWANDEQFREEVIKTTLQKNLELDESLQLYELVMTEIALDVFMETA